jgi:hypothetical protein
MIPLPFADRLPGDRDVLLWRRFGRWVVTTLLTAEEVDAVLRVAVAAPECEPVPGLLAALA